MTRLLTLWTLLLLSGPARAEDPPAPPAPPTAFEQLDKQFGELFVAPLASLLFYDLYFWDNTLPLGEGVGERVKDEEIVGYDAATGYAYARRFEAPAADARVQLTEPREVQIAGINLIITPREEGRLSAELKSGQTVDIAGRRTTQLDQLVPPPEGLPESALNREEGVDRVLVRDLAPFGVPVEVRDGVATTLTTRFTLPPTALVPRVGDTVVVGEETAEVVGINGDKLDLRDADRRQSAEPLKNTTQISLPFIVTWLVLGAVFGVAVSRVKRLRLGSVAKGALLGVFYIEIVSQPILVSAPLLVTMSAPDVLQWYVLSTAMHLIYGIVLGVVLALRQRWLARVAQQGIDRRSATSF